MSQVVAAKQLVDVRRIIARATALIHITGFCDYHMHCTI
jgi:hypothetical protein